MRWEVCGRDGKDEMIGKWHMGRKLEQDEAVCMHTVMGVVGVIWH
jgi:hypothetical protein